MKLIVGLGNPGLPYKNTRHNIGFLVVEKLAEELKIKFNKKQHSGLIGEGQINQGKLILLKPLTYMNLSGLSVGSLIRKKDIAALNLLVVCDDVNLKLGTIRLRGEGSHGGHNGLKSIIQEINTSDFPRLRVGIGKDSHSSFLSDFVLSPFSKLEKRAVNKIINAAVGACLSWLNSSLAATMNKFNKNFGID